MAEPRSLVDELRRVDDAFSQLKPARDDVVEGLLAGDVELLIAHGNRGLRAGRVRQGFAVAGIAAAVAVVVFAAMPRPVKTSRPTATAVAMPVPVSTPVPTPLLPAVTNSSSSSSAPSPSSAPSSLTLRAMTSTSAPKTPAMRVVPTETTPPLATTSPSSSLRGTARDIDVRVEGIAVVAPDVVSDDDVDTALLSARRFAARGAHAEAAGVLQALLARGPGGRVVDVVSSEEASLLAKAGQVPAACAVWSAHRERFASSDNSAAVVAALARHRCP